MKGKQRHADSADHLAAYSLITGFTLSGIGRWRSHWRLRQSVRSARQPCATGITFVIASIVGRNMSDQPRPGRSVGVVGLCIVGLLIADGGFRRPVAIFHPGFGRNSF